MRTPPRPLVLAALLPFLTGCFGVLPAPLPSPNDRERANIRGVVVREDDGTERNVPYDEIYQVQWAANSLIIVGSRNDDGGGLIDATDEYRYTDLSGVLTRQVDAAKTSMLVAGALVGSIAAIAIWVNGQANDNTTLGGT